MDHEKQIAQALIESNLSFPEWLNGVAVAKKVREMDIPANQLLESIETAADLRDPGFRAAALHLLELEKRTKKGGKELDAYIGKLSSRSSTLERENADKEKLKLNLEQEIKQYQQKLRDEKEKLKSEQAKNRRVLAEDTEKLERQLKKNSQTRENITQAVTLRDMLEGVGFDVPTFIHIAREVSQNGKIDLPLGKEISKRIIECGALLKAIEMARRGLEAVKASVVKFSQMESEKRENLKILESQTARKNAEFDKVMQGVRNGQSVIKSQNEQIETNRWQYEFFETFISMLLNSPSAAKKEDLVTGFGDSALGAVGLMIKSLEKKGWVHSTKASSEERRGIFIVTVIGAYLRSIHCEHCGTSFIVNKKYNFDNRYRSSYYCPVCVRADYTKPDASFLEAMVSPALATRLQAVTKLTDLGDPALVKLSKLVRIIPEDMLKTSPEDEELKWHLSEDGILIERSKP